MEAKNMVNLDFPIMVSARNSQDLLTVHLGLPSLSSILPHHLI